MRSEPVPTVPWMPGLGGTTAHLPGEVITLLLDLCHGIGSGEISQPPMLHASLKRVYPYLSERECAQLVDVAVVLGLIIWHDPDVS